MLTPICADCATDHPEGRPGYLVAVSENDFADTWGYDTAVCEECKTVVYDGLAGILP